MLGSARRLVAFHAAVIVSSMLLPAAALGAKPSSPGGGKKQQSLWSTAYTYKDCYEADLARAPDPGSVTGWQPSAPDAGAVVATDENDGDSPHAGSTVSTGIRINSSPVFQALPPVLPGYGVARSTSECTGTATSNRDNGALAAGSTWKAMSVDPTWQGASTAGAGVWKLIQVRDSVSSLKVTSVFTTAVGGLEAAKTGAGYADVLGTLYARPLNCDPACPFQSDYIVLARNNLQGFAAVTPGDQTVVLTLRAPDGQKLPQGYYQIAQLLSTWSSNLRVADQSSSATATVTAKGFTVTTTP